MFQPGRRLSWFVVCVVSAGVTLEVSCSPPPPDLCTRLTVSANGIVDNGGFAGGVAGGFAGGVAGGFGGFGGGTALEPQRFTGDEVTLVVSAPLTACVSDSLRSRVEVLGPDSMPVNATLTEPVRAADGHVESTVRFTPTAGGTWVIHVAFEPSLGVRTKTVEVIPAFTEQGLEVTLPALVRCAGAPWPVSADTLACESDGGVFVVRADAGVSSFSGAQLVGVGDVLWTVAGGELHRHVVSSQAVTLTHMWNGFTDNDGFLHGLHSKTVAVRPQNGLMTAVTLDGGTPSVRAFGGSDSSVFFYEGSGLVLEAGRGNFCPSGECFQNMVAIDPDFVWTSPAGDAVFLTSTRRPAMGMNLGASGPSMTVRASFPALAPGGLERVPLFDDRGGARMVLISSRDHALHFTSWPRGRIERVGGDFVVLSTDAGYRLAPLP